MSEESSALIEKETLDDLIKKYTPTEILEVKMSEWSVPIETAAEVSQLYAVEKKVLIELLENREVHEETGKTVFDPQTLKWARELRQTAKLIHELTGKVQEKQLLKKMDIAGELYKKVMENMTPQEQRAAIKNMRDNT